MRRNTQWDKDLLGAQSWEVGWALGLRPQSVVHTHIPKSELCPRLTRRDHGTPPDHVRKVPSLICCPPRLPRGSPQLEGARLQLAAPLLEGS